MRLEARHDLGGRFSWARATSQLQGFHVCSVSGFDVFVLSVHRFPIPAVRGSMSFRDAISQLPLVYENASKRILVHA